MHTLDYFAAKAKPLLDLLDAKRNEGLKRDRELRELNDEIDGLAAKLGALNTEAAEAGHLIADVHAAAAEIKDDAGEEKAAPAEPASATKTRGKRAK